MRTLIALALAAALPSAAALACDAGTACFCDTSPCDNFQCSGALSCDQAVLFCGTSRCHMDCTGQGSCKQSHLQCVSDYCQVRCTRDQSCQQMKTYADSGILTTISLDPIGRDYGIWTAAKASDGKVICDGDQSCQQTTVGCASDKCELVCNGQQACEQAGYDVKSSSEGALVRCTNRQSCQQASFDFEDIAGDAELVCDNQLGCTQATVVCPSRHSLVVRCNGVKSCEQMTLRAPSTMLPGQRCHLECVGQLACSGIDQSRVTGGVTATCSSGAGCSGFLQPNTDAPTPVPTPAPTLPPCNNWKLKLSVFTFDCDTLCTGILNIAQCTQYCECADTDVPVTASPTAAPPAPITTPMPTLDSCDDWRVKVSGVSVDCNNICKVLQQFTVCSSLCECVPVPPPTPVPGANCTNWRLTLPISSVDCNAVCVGVLNNPVCTSACECVDTAAPRDLPTPVPETPAPENCTNWQLKVGGIVTFKCDSICFGVLDLTECKQFCECIDTAAPGTIAPATPAPATIAPPTPVPTENCTNWRLRVPVVGLSIDCDDVCISVLNNTLCTQFCECTDTDAPATLVPVPETPAPGTRILLKKLFRITCGILRALFDRAAFLRALLRLLGSLVTDVKVHWTCPASACINGCPSTSLKKVSAGCKAIVATTERLAEVLAEEEEGMVLEVSADYSDSGSEDAVNTVLQQEAAAPTELKEFNVQRVVVVETEVLELQEASSDDDDLAPGYIALIVILCVAVVAGIAVAVVCCLMRPKQNQESNANHPDKDAELGTNDCEPVAPVAPVRRLATGEQGQAPWRP